MSVEKDLVCPVCGRGTYPYKKWVDEGSSKLRIRATWATPYSRKGTAWFYGSHIKDEVTPVHGVVDSARFGRCGYQDIELGLSIDVKLEDGGGVGWAFYNYGDIAEFFERAKAYELKNLVGTPVIAYMGGKGGIGSSILGIDIVDSLVIRKHGGT